MFDVEKKCSCGKVLKLNAPSELALNILKGTSIKCDDCIKAFQEHKKKTVQKKRINKALDCLKSEIPKKYHHQTSSIKKYCPRIVSQVNEFLSGDNHALFLYGGVGTGKTCLSFALAYSLALMGQKLKFRVSTDLLGAVQGLTPSDRYALICDVKEHDGVLVIDDLGSEKQTEAGVQAYFEIINYRYSRNLYTIYSSNKVASEICKGDERIGRRIKESFFIDMHENDLSFLK